MKRRKGDIARINGNYQYKAITEGNPVQRFWHHTKKLSINQYMLPEGSDFIVDAGCGSGVITSFLGETGATVIGIDGNVEAIKFATSKYKSSNIKFMHGFVGENLELGRLVDKIYCLEVIEHIYYDQAINMLKSFYNILKPGGKVFLTTPNYKSLWPLIEYTIDLFGKTPPLKGHQHVEFYNKIKLKNLVRSVGFDVELIFTTCLLAPWIAAINWNLALRLHSFESKLPLQFGSILNCILVKRT